MAPEFLPTFMQDAYDLVEAYANFWKRFGKVASKPVQPSALTIQASQEVEGESLRIEIGRDHALAILGVASGGVRGTEYFDVFVSGMQVVRKAKGLYEGEHVWITVRSEFEVLYLNALEKKDAKKAWDANEKVSTAYAGFQFVVDTGSNCQPHSADCAAKYCLDQLEENAIQRRYKDDDDGWAWRATHRQPAVPAAPLDLAGLLYVVLHQHDRAGVLTGWPREMREALERLPVINLERRERTLYGQWFEHSHSTPDDVPWDSPKRQLEDFIVPPDLAADGWGARIAGRERNETPHLSVNHRRDRKRVNLRTGEFMDGDPKWIPEELAKEIKRTFSKWQDLWDFFYKDVNPIKDEKKTKKK
jgi:hypothetical protein